MKHKKIILNILISLLSICIILLSFLCYFKSKNYQNNGLLIGNKIDNIELEVELNDSFTNEYMSSSYLEKMLTMDASKVIDEKLVKLSSLIKNSNYIFINIGSYDLTYQIKYDEIDNKFTFDEQILGRQINTTSKMVDNIIASIVNTNNKALVYLCCQPYPYEYFDDSINKMFNILNNNYKNIVQKYQIKLLSV